MKSPIQYSCGCEDSNLQFPSIPGTPGSVWYNGTGAPASNLGIIGDYYLNNANGQYYQKTVSGWGSPIGTFTGANGSNGTNGTTVFYDNWTAVQNGSGAGLVDLKTTTIPVPILTDSSGLKIETGFTVVPPSVNPFILLKLLYGSINLYGYAYVPVFSSGIATVDWDVEITRIDNTNIRFKSWVSWMDKYGIISNQNKYFTVSNQSVSTLATGSIIKTQADGQNTNDVTCEYLKVLSFIK